MVNFHIKTDAAKTRAKHKVPSTLIINILRFPLKWLSGIIKNNWGVDLWRVLKPI